MQVVGEFGVAKFIEILNVVRNKILDFVLVGRNSREAGDFRGVARKDRTAKAHRYSTPQFMAAQLTSSAMPPRTRPRRIQPFYRSRDFDSLVARGFARRSIRKNSSQSLKEAAQADPKPKSQASPRFGPKVRRLDRQNGDKAATGVWDKAVDAGGVVPVQSYS